MYLPPIVVEFRGDDSPLLRTIAEAKAALLGFKDDIEGASRVNMDNLARTVDNVAKSVKNADTDTNRWKQRLAELNNAARVLIPGLRMIQDFGRGFSGGSGFLGKLSSGFKEAWTNASQFERIIATLLGSGAGLPALVAGVGALVIAVSGMLGGFAAATLGLGALGAAFVVMFSHSKAAKTQFKEMTSDLLGLAYQGIKPLLPQMMALIRVGFQIARNLVPAFVDLAKAALPAVTELARELARFTASKGFMNWIHQISAIAKPAIISLGHSIGTVSVTLGKFFTILGQKDTIEIFQVGIRIMTDVLVGVVKMLEFTIKEYQFWARAIGVAVHYVSQQVDQWRTAISIDVRIVVSIWQSLVSHIEGFVRAIISAWHNMTNAGANVVSDVQHFVSDVAGALSRLVGIAESVASRVASALSNMIPGGIIGSVAHALGFANGTLYAPPGYHMVGEKGPELMLAANTAIAGYASGTRGASRGFAMVGEKGPELMYFHGGEVVIPNHALSGTGGYAGGVGGIEIPVTIHLDGQVIYKNVESRVYSKNMQNGIRNSRGGAVGRFGVR